ncbi:MAG: molecular chaperone DnaJ [Nanoarchaeota archaeon]|nr:MAG: molecular chaperone DnaJ [Nanoarchaeota archaeon]
MPTVKIKGFEVSVEPVKDSAHRRSVQFTNKIIEVLGKIGISVDDIEIEEEPSPMRKAPASARWYAEGTHCFYSYSRATKYVDNLQVVLKVLETEVNGISKGNKTREEFIDGYREEHDIEQERKDSREMLGLAHDHNDLNTINSAFKKKSLELHPDMPGGDTEKFKQLNKAHKTLRRELE